MNTKKIIITLLLVAIGSAGLYFLAFNTHFINTFSYNSWHPMGRGFFHGHMMMGGFMHLFFWLIILYFIVSAFGSRKTAVAYSTDSAVEILKKKYVNGDISKAEYSDKMRHLSGE